MMAGGGGRLSARAKNPAGWRLRGEGHAPRFAPLPVLFPSYSAAYTYSGLLFLKKISGLNINYPIL
ncbi:hypothetical protein DK079_12410 [Salmonella enterica subsp. enterica serovar Typhimurium]|nr:hypothetical protein [Salmonella enterica subsp. enterica serovar Typhimurium]EBY7650512.1 hypothetical protein [Salmonella enterica subsp. enterica serovar Typhimurium]